MTECIMRCPKCRATLEFTDTLAECRSQACNAAFPKVDGVPILLDETSSMFSFADFQKTKIIQPSLFTTIKGFGLKILPSLDLNISGQANMQKLGDLLFEQAELPVILNIGGKHPASACAHLCARPDVVCYESDVMLRPRTNLIADPCNLPFADASVDLILIDGVLEHLLEPFIVADEIHRVLKANGLVYSDTPFMLQVHGGAIDFFRFSHLGHRRLFRRFEEIASGITSGPAVALGYSIQYFLLSFGRSNTARFVVKAFCRLTLFWLKYFDLVLAQKPGALDAAHGLYFMGRKSNTPIADHELIASYEGISPDLYKLTKTDIGGC